MTYIKSKIRHSIDWIDYCEVQSIICLGLLGWVWELYPKTVYQLLIKDFKARNGTEILFVNTHLYMSQKVL